MSKSFAQAELRKGASVTVDWVSLSRCQEGASVDGWIVHRAYRHRVRTESVNAKGVMETVIRWVP